MKSVSVFKLIVVVILCALFFMPLGCSSSFYDQMGESAAEGRRRHARTARINRQELMKDLDEFFLLNEPSKLTDRRMP